MAGEGVHILVYFPLCKLATGVHAGHHPQPAHANPCQSAPASQPLPASSRQPLPASPCQPAHASPCQPAPASQPMPTPASQPLPASPCQPAPASQLTPAPASQLMPAPASQLTPAPASQLMPAPASQLTPAAASQLTPAPASPCQPAHASQPLPASPCQPAHASPCQPAHASPCQPAHASPCQPLPASPCQPAHASQPLPASPCQPAHASQPLPASPCQPAHASQLFALLHAHTKKTAGGNKGGNFRSAQWKHMPKWTKINWSSQCKKDQSSSVHWWSRSWKVSGRIRMYSTHFCASSITWGIKWWYSRRVYFDFDELGEHHTFKISALIICSVKSTTAIFCSSSWKAPCLSLTVGQQFAGQQLAGPNINTGWQQLAGTNWMGSTWTYPKPPKHTWPFNTHLTIQYIHECTSKTHLTIQHTPDHPVHTWMYLQNTPDHPIHTWLNLQNTSDHPTHIWPSSTYMNVPPKHTWPFNTHFVIQHTKSSKPLNTHLPLEPYANLAAVMTSAVSPLFISATLRSTAINKVTQLLNTVTKWFNKQAQWLNKNRLQSQYKAQ